MSLIRRVKNYYGFGMPWDNPVTDHWGPLELDPSQYPGGATFTDANGASSMFTASGRGDSFKYTGINSCSDAYYKCPPLSSIINRKTQAHINGKTWVMDKKGKESTSKEAKKIRNLFAKPNAIENEEQFKARIKIYMQVYGWCIVLPIIPAGYEKYGVIEAASMWVIPPYMVDVEETNKLFYQSNLEGIVAKIKLNYRGQVTELPLDKIIIFKDIVPSLNSFVFPDSRVKLVSQPINNIIVSLESQGEVTAYAGSQGIITPDSAGSQYTAIAMDPKDKEQLQHDFKRQYGIRRGMFRYIISPMPIKFQGMGTEPRKLMLTEFVLENAKAICDEYGYPPHLMGLIDPTFNNQNLAGKSLYQDTIIPECDGIDATWKTAFKAEDYGLSIETTYDHLPILQEDEVQKASARLTRNQALLIEWQNNLITRNRWLELNGEDTIGPEGDVYYEDVKEPEPTSEVDEQGNIIPPTNGNGKHLKYSKR